MKTSFRTFGFLTLPKYSMIALTSAIEALRMANQLRKDELYRWSVYSVDERTVLASNGIAAGPSRVLDLAQALPDVVFVCGGWDVRDAVTDEVTALLRSLAARGVALGGLCTGAYALMASSLLDGYRCAVHWEVLPEMHAEFPGVRFVDELFAIDRDRITCTGGTAPLDMMLHLITHDQGRAMARDISEQFSIDCVREVSDPQPIPVASRVGFSRQELVETVRLMEANIDEPLPMPELARLAGVSMRHLQRVFRDALNTTPYEYYVGIRLRQARKLIRYSNMPIATVTKQCGFQSTTHFSRAFRSFFGHAPSHERRAGDPAS
ncbi:GlxA family transcriptional regulator [Burkholderia multivorans]|uniref:GlxA family transcriptional regulator n=1 Tax=Burkholderia multivorans TaxID=87883 RepID=UPI000841A1C9|nr:GlxA family transcriptional regulator [Burkholderia multivorans]AOJ96197.1 AraC family transcriptional regulator [Burkholderia multivorans]MCO1340851.1 GlxA family transcriptional regulator [Burkholderia multivorans]MCO1439975.1 GlxA family transcriptional regulator [Burkholderia multivorans]MDR8751406.1 HTH-type transcriptional regulator CdhR [Burkholderia multivorans]MDR8807428.1 HTH-type transcriptional regulator CdhR [Burkholderia multivorans]